MGGVANAASASRAREAIVSEDAARREDNSKMELKIVLLIELRRRVARNVKICSRDDTTCWGASSAVRFESMVVGASLLSLLSLPLSRGSSKREGYASKK